VAARLIPNLIPLEIKSVFQHEQTQEPKGLIPDETLGYKYAPGLTDFPVPFTDGGIEEIYHISTVSLGYADAGFRDDGLGSNSFDNCSKPDDKKAPTLFWLLALIRQLPVLKWRSVGSN
jgi:hypothetical protein